ncbi:MAG TPA: N-acetylmuramoyl-L-alanine amidase [Rickettsiales bacterium]|nr:N-acetylmuramoyl-L-alanine amidase [Rickettsiales bacterium]
MKKSFFLTFFIIFIINSNLFAAINIEKISFDAKQNIEILISEKTDFKAYILENPQRIVLDIENAIINSNIIPKKFPSLIKNIRKGLDKNNLRIVFDLNQKINIQSTGFYKSKNSKNGKILIRIIQQNSATKSVKSVSISKKLPQKIPIIVIDAGHGGKDPGAVGGYVRTKEKNITLSYAKELAKHLSANKKYKVYLTRGSDNFIPLKERITKARKVKADLFISLHADSAEDRKTKGLSIYTLSEKSSDKQAELLAQKENRADIISGINFDDTSGDILKTLIDLSQRNSMNHSSRFANIAIKSIAKNNVEILHNTHRFAGFVVLTAPDMVSVLIELGYLSNKNEEKNLNSLVHKRRVVRGLVTAIDEYFKFR